MSEKKPIMNKAAIANMDNMQKLRNIKKILFKVQKEAEGLTEIDIEKMSHELLTSLENINNGKYRWI